MNVGDDGRRVLTPTRSRAVEGQVFHILTLDSAAWPRCDVIAQYGKL